MELKDELWWQNLEEWIFDESKLVTYKYIASSLKIHVNAAKKMLYTFHKESNRKTFAIYLVVGRIKEGCHVKLIADKDMEKRNRNLIQFCQSMCMLLDNHRSMTRVIYQECYTLVLQLMQYGFMR